MKALRGRNLISLRLCGRSVNFIKVVDTGFPFPFAAIKNCRSMIYVRNLVDFIIKCFENPAAVNQTFLVADNQDLSLSELFGIVRENLGKPSRLLPVTPYLFRIVGLLTGKKMLLNGL